MGVAATTGALLGRSLASDRRRQPACRPVRGTLEDRILGVWEALTADGSAGCPVCGGTMEMAGDKLARCGGCHAELS